MKKEKNNPLIKGSFLLLLFILSNYCNAQYYRIDSFYEDPVWGRLDTLFDQNYKPIALLGSKKSVYSFKNDDFSVFNLKKEKILTVFFNYRYPDHKCHWDFYFASGNHVRMSRNDGMSFMKKNLLDILDEYKMIQGDKIGPEAEKKFIEVHGGTYNQANQVNDAAEILPSIAGNNIMVGNKIIGQFLFKYDESDSTRIISVLINKFVDESRVAEAFFPLGNDVEWSINTLIDNKAHNVYYFREDGLEKLFTWIFRNKYLN